MDQAVSRALRDLRVWDTLSPSECERWLALLRRSFHRLFSSLASKPTRLVPSSITLPASTGNDPSQPSPTTFALVPGGAATLGYDTTQRPAPSQKLVREWMGFWEDEEET